MIEPIYKAEAKRYFIPSYDEDGKQVGSLPITHRYLFITTKHSEEFRILIHTRKGETNYTLSKKRQPKTGIDNFLTNKEKLKQDQLLEKQPWIKVESMSLIRLRQMLNIWLGDQAEKAYEDLIAAEAPKKRKKNVSDT
jgi:hypothetical protein